MSNRRRKKNDPKSTAISLLIMVLFLLPGEVTAVLVALAAVIVPVVLIVRKLVRSGNVNSGRKKAEQPFDDCPKPLCFHRDKGEHHVVRGREIDPWDRPDIDISKYQRRN
jgi:hypothetical protein